MKSRTVIISDLHLEGGPADPGGGHAHQGSEFPAFIRMLIASPKIRIGELDLSIAGDFFKLAQAHQNRPPGFRCSEEGSFEKLEVIGAAPRAPARGWCATAR